MSLVYQVNSSIRDGSFYVKREADDDLFNSITEEQYCNILAPRQIGKTSLCDQTIKRLLVEKKDDFHCALIDLQGLSKIDEQTFYNDLIQELINNFRLKGVKLKDILSSYQGNSPSFIWTEFIKNILLTHIKGHIVIFIDEIDKLFTFRSLGIDTDTFFDSIRKINGERSRNPEYNRLVFCLIGVASPEELIENKIQTPYNIGKEISLTDFSIDQMQSLSLGLEKVANPQLLLREIYEWTNGHPYMTLSLCKALSSSSPIETALVSPTIKSLVEQLFLKAIPKDSNLSYAEERFKAILANSENGLKRSEFLETYQHLLTNKKLKIDKSNPFHSELKLTGIAAEDPFNKGFFIVRNRIFEHFFDFSWLEKQQSCNFLTAAYSSWLAAGKPDNLLLYGEDLKKAKLLLDTNSLSPDQILFILKSDANEQLINKTIQFECQRVEDLKKLDLEKKLANTERLAKEQKAKSNTRLRIISVGLAIAFIIAIIASVLAYSKSIEAQQNALAEQTQRKKAIEGQISFYQEQARRELVDNNNPLNAALYASRAYQIAEDSHIDIKKYPTTQFVLAQAMQKSVDPYLFTLNHQDSVIAANFSPDSQLIVTSSYDNTAKVWNLNGNLLATLNHQGRVYSANFSPDSQLIVTSSKDKTAKVWNLNGNLLATLNHKDIVRAANFSPDNQLIITFSNDKTAKVWDLKGTLLATLNHKDIVYSANFSPDSQRIVTSSKDKTAKAWNLNGNLLATLNHKDSVNSANFSPDNQRIVTSSGDTDQLTLTAKGEAKVWDINGTLLATLSHQGRVYSANFSPDSQHIVTSSYDKTAKVWDIKGTLLTTLSHQDSVIAANFSPDSQRIVTASSDKTAKVWDIKSNLLATLPHIATSSGYKFIQIREAIALDINGNTLPTLSHQNSVLEASFSPDSQRIVTASGNLRTEKGEAKIWDLKGNLLATLSHKGRVYSANFSPDNQRIVTSSGDLFPIKGGAKIWDLKGTLLATLSHKGGVREANFSPDSQLIITVSYDNTAKVWNLNGNLLATLPHQNSVNSANFSPDNQRIVTSSSDNTAKVWNLNGNLLATLPHQDSVNSANFSPDNRHIVTASGNTGLLTSTAKGEAKVWNLNGNLLATLSHQDIVNSANFSPDNQRIVTVSDVFPIKGEAKVLDLKGTLLATLSHQGGVREANFSPDSQFIVTSSYDNTAKVWNLNGNLLATLSHKHIVYSANFSPDSQCIVTSSYDNTAKVWDIHLETRKPKEILEKIDKVSPYKLTEDGRIVLK